MAKGGKAAERRRLAEALRANLRRRKAAKPAPGRTSRETERETSQESWRETWDTPAAEPGRDGERG